MLLGTWDERSGELTIIRDSGQKYVKKQPMVTAGSHKVFGVTTVGNEVHVLTGPKQNPKPNRRVKFSDANSYKGSTSF